MTEVTPDILEVIAEQNPWSVLQRVPTEFAPDYHRHLARSLWRTVRHEAPRFQLVLGPRRVGKTTVMYQTVSRLISDGVEPHRLWWLRLDHPFLMRFELGELVRAVLNTQDNPDPAHPVHLFLDELTYARDWDLWLKTFFDEKWPVRIIASSSATEALRSRRLESGVGRWEEQMLSPWLFDEYLDLKQEQHERLPLADTLSASLEAVLERRVHPDLSAQLRRFILVGGFPELLTITGPDEASVLLRSQKVLRSDAVERAVYRDLPQTFGIREPHKLERLLYILAGQLGGLFSAGTISADVALTQPTVDKYTSYLERAFIVFRLANYASSEETVQRRGRKLYFADGAVRNATLQRGIAPLADQAELGLLFENAAAAHLHALASRSGVRLYHWRHRKDEVDLVYDDPHGPVAFEITASKRHVRRGLAAFQNRFPRYRNRCFIVYPGAVPSSPTEANGGVGKLPLDVFLLTVGRQAQRALDQHIEAFVA